MAFTIDFILTFFKGLFYAGPILAFLLLLIITLGQWVGKKEAWTKIDALYYSFITATTVGYGDFRPTTDSGKFIAIGIAIIGLLLTGIIVALGVKAAAIAFEHIYDIPVIKK